jgi:TRADD-N domain-containing protein
MSDIALSPHSEVENPPGILRLRRLLPGSKNAKLWACEQVAEAQSVSQIGAALSKLTEAYYRDVLKQAKRSFAGALAASLVAASLFFIGLNSAMHGAKTANLSLAAGALVEVLAGINFYLYSRTSRQFSSFHICLERANRFLLVNAICDTLPQGGEQEAMRRRLIDAMLRAPMLTVAEVTGVVDSSERRSKEAQEPFKTSKGGTGSKATNKENERGTVGDGAA